ncbi:MAG: beta-propeller domain-containing protein [Patescibacteria group bacterium]|jgi:inhibitor of cysteine peptidase|nr:beta-propeller domain-containing protein [Patescibacteria group bacterium]
MQKNLKLFILFLALTFVLSACSFSLSKNPTTVQPENNIKPTEKVTENIKTDSGSKTIENILASQSEIKKFDNPEELKEFLENSQVNSGENYYRSDMVFADSSFGGMEVAEMATDGMMLKSAPQAVPTAPGLGSAEGENDFSQTNVQVEGVDESDIVKTDGDYIYSLTQNELFIIKASPASEAKIVSKIKFESSPKNIYINKNKLVVFGEDFQVSKETYSQSFRRNSSYTYFKIFDISDRSEPSQLRDIRFEGSYANSRMIGDYVYFVTNTYNYYIDGEPILPRVLEDGVDTACTAEKCIMPDVYYFDIPYNRYNFSSVNVVDLANINSDVEREVYILSDNQNMYVSESNIYITYTKYISEEQLVMEMTKEILVPKLPQKEADKIVAIDLVEEFILSDSEKIRKISAILERYIQSLPDDEQEKLEKQVEEEMKKKYEDISKELEKTVIHKVEINGSDIEYKTSGEVTGHVLNQFSMDENKGYFRIATTKNRTWSRFDDGSNESYSNLYVLDKDLKQVGALEDLAPDERIYSVRFMQNRAYLVTFKQTDPLFVIDLSDARNPKVLGELKIPGFSNYLHPYDETTLIGIGKDAKLNEYERVVTGGLKISLFDVSDVANPKEADSIIIGGVGSDSIALNDHKAFLFSSDKNLLVIPATLREVEGENRYGKINFRGALWFDIKKDSVELKERISHFEEGELEGKQYYWNGYGYYDASVKRSLYINDVLYTVSDKYLKINSLTSSDEVNKLELSLEKKDDFEIINNN